MNLSSVSLRRFLAAVSTLLGVGSALGSPVPGEAQVWNSYLYANDMRGIAATPQGIFCATGGGVLLFEPGSGAFRQWNREANGLSSDSLTSVAVEPSGSILFGTATQGISSYSPATGVFTPITSLLDPIPSNEVHNVETMGGWRFVFATGGFSVFEDGELRWPCVRGLDDLECEVPSWDLVAGVVNGGEVWVGGRPLGNDLGGVGVLDLESSEWTDVSPTLPGRRVRDLALHDGSVWAATDSTVCEWDGGAWIERAQGLPDSVLWMDLHSDGGGLWVGGADGVFAWNTGAASWSRVGTRSIPVSQVTSDAQGGLWAGASARALGVSRLSVALDGLWEFSGGDWIQHRQPGPDYRHHYRDIEFDSRGRLRASIAQSQQVPLLATVDGGQWSFINKGGSSGLGNAWSFKLLADGDALWLGNCCCRCESEQEPCYSEVLVPGGVRRYEQAVNIRDMARDRHGRIWFASFNENDACATGLSRLDPSDSTWIEITTNDEPMLKSNSIRAVAVQGTILWVGYAEQGVSRWDLGPDEEPMTTDDFWAHYSSTDPLNRLLGNLTTKIAVGPDAVWLGSTAGITYVVGQNETFITSGFDRLPSPGINDILPTADGGAWVATRRGGLTKVTPTGSGDFTFETLGPPGLVHPDIETVAQSPDGRSLWLGTAWGLSSLQPSVSGSGSTERPGAYPNPFRPVCGHRLRLTGIEGRVDGVIVDTGGREVGRFEGAAPGDIVWDGRFDGVIAPPGLYMVRLRSAAGVRSIAVALLDGDCGF